MRSFQGNGVQGNRDGLGKQSLSLARNPLDAGISSIILFKKNQRRGGIFPPRRLIFIITDIFRNVSVIFYPICLFFLYRPV